MTSFWRIHEKHKNAERVQLFVNKMKEAGVKGGSEHDSYVYEQDGFVAVVAYRPVDGELVGSIMTKHVFEQMKIDMRNSMSSLSTAYFAWAYGYGYNYMEDGFNPEYIMTHIQGFTNLHARMNKMGRAYLNIMFMVLEWRDVKPKGECGVMEEGYLVGIHEDVDRAEYMMERAMSNKLACNSRFFSIKPIAVNTQLEENEYVSVGSVCRIE